MSNTIRIGTRESQLAIWQATLVKSLLEKNGHTAILIPIKSEGDIDIVTPLYAMGVQGIFTRSLDIALLNNKIDIAVHSMKDVPVQLPDGIVQAAVLKRASYKDILVINDKWKGSNRSWVMEHLKLEISNQKLESLSIATSSIRRKAQWLHRYPDHQIDNLRGNVNTRLKKLESSNWFGAIFAAAGLERINLRPANSIDLNWMLPAPAQGAIMVAGRKNDENVFQALAILNDNDTDICVKIERDFLSKLMGGCSTPISALAVIEKNKIHFTGNVVAADGTQKLEIARIFELADKANAGKIAAEALLRQGAGAIIAKINHEK